MTNTGIGRLGCVMLLLASAAVPAQNRSVEPLPSLAPLIEEVAPAVVNISVRGTIDRSGQAPFGGDQENFLERFFRDQLPPTREFNNAGSGVIVDADRGYLLTNDHVIAQGGEITVTLVDNRSFVASIVGSDPESDLAVLQIEGTDLTEIPLTSTDNLKVGDYVVAIGNPFGFANTVTAGIVSGLGRHFINDDELFEDFIQTDASINPGNSGGALVNLEGRLIGINSAIISGTGGNVGIGFAIPSEMVVSVMDQLIENGEVRRGLLGVRMHTVTPSFAEDYGLEVTSGALVAEVLPETAASAAGIRINDVIVGVNGTTVADGNELRNKVAMIPPGETVELQIVRGGRERTVDAVLGARESERETPAPVSVPEPTSALDGVDLESLSAAEGGPGLRIVDLSIESSQVVRETLFPGDIILAINQQRVRDPAEARRIAEEARTVTLEIERDSRPRLVRIR